MPRLRRSLAPLLALVCCTFARGDEDLPRAIDPRVRIELFAEAPQIVTPTGIAVDAAGRVLSIESHTHFPPEGYAGPKADRIQAFEDTDGDGRADRVTTFFEGTRATMNLAVYHDGSVYVATRSEIFRLRDTDGDGAADQRTPIAHLETAGDYPHNGLSGFAFDFAGDVVFGFGENLGADYTLIGADGARMTGGGEGGNIYRCRPDGSGLYRVATGFWNPFHVCFDAFGRLFAVDNDPDSRPPCRLLHIVPEGDYGYRFRNGRKGLHPFTSWNGELPGTLPMVAGTGEAPSGMIAYESDLLPADYRGDLLVTSWGDHRIERYELERRGASFVATMQPVIAGGENFRPVGIALAADGSLYVSDWVDKSYELHGRGRIWRISADTRAIAPREHTGGRSDETPPMSNVAPAAPRPTDPRDGIHSAHGPLREASARALARDPADGHATLVAAAQSDDQRVRATALQGLLLGGSAEVDYAVTAQTDPSADVRELLIRTLPRDHFDAQPLSAGLLSPAELAEVLRRGVRSRGPRAESLPLLNSEDPFLRQAAMLAVGRNDSHYLPHKTPRERIAAVLLSRGGKDVGDERGIQNLADYLADPDPDVRFVAVQWVGEERLEEHRDALLAGLADGATTRRLFEAYLAALAMLDGRPLEAIDEYGGDRYILDLLTNAEAAPAVRRRALRMLPPAAEGLTTAILGDLLAGEDESLRLEAARSLRERADRDAREALHELVANDAADALRAEAVVGLSPLDATERELLLALAEEAPSLVADEALRSLRGGEWTAAERARLESLAARRSEAGDLVARLLAPASGGAAIPPAGDLDSWLELLEGPADAAAGERVFFSRAANCARCHAVDGRGGRIGPELSATTLVLNRRRLVDSILSPSREIAPQFVAWNIVTADGQALTGMPLGDKVTGEQIYADQQGRTFELRPEQIDERQQQQRSIMPDDLAKGLTVQEFRDLLAYLQAPR